MPVHVVAQGECFSSIAARYGIKSWRELYEHPDNAELKKKRPNPNVLAPGDEVVVPEPDKKWMERTTEKKHRFVVPAAKVRLRIVLRGPRGEALGGKHFIVDVGDDKQEGTSTPEGLIEVEVAALAVRARLRAWLSDATDGPPNIDRDLAIGHIDPIETIGGVQARLANLGYGSPVDRVAPASPDAPTLAAARAFRAKHGLPEVARPEPEEEDGEPTDEQVAGYVEKLLDDAFRSALSTDYEARGGG
jgi:N-acetylmuramoyl-L-alanine amidase